MKVTITKVTADDKKKDGTPLINKYGKPYFKVGIQTNEFGTTWINGLMPFKPDRWEGTSQEVEVYDEEYQGKTYKKFKLPPREGKGGMTEDQYRALMQQLTAINANILRVWSAVDPDRLLTSAGTKVPDFSEVKLPNEMDDAELASLEAMANT